jgi:hypothetical protein
MKLMILNGSCYFACSNCPQGSNFSIMKWNHMNGDFCFLFHTSCGNITTLLLQQTWITRSTWCHIPLTSFDHIWDDTFCNHARTIANIPNCSIYFLMNYDCHRHTHTDTQTQTQTCLVLLYWYLDCNFCTVNLSGSPIIQTVFSLLLSTALAPTAGSW